MQFRMNTLAPVQQLKKILVADDDPCILEAVKIALEFEGFEVIATADVGNLLDFFKEKPVLILMDIMMAGYDGREICRMLKTKQATRNIPVILYSASYDVIDSVYKAGANDFIAKPFEIQELLDKIGKHAKL